MTKCTRVYEIMSVLKTKKITDSWKKIPLPFLEDILKIKEIHLCKIRFV